MTASAILDLLITMLAEITGRGRGHWRRVLGEVKVHPLSTNPRCNWLIEPTGSDQDVAVALKAIEVVAQAHPYVDRTR